jgi:hypothetical protein
VDNQHRMIKGYVDFTQEEIDLINRIKALAEDVGTFVLRVSQSGLADERWVDIATVDLQKGFMALVRSVAQPETF